MKSGIYKITFGADWSYVGQTNNFSARWANHRSRLRDGRHYNRVMQHAWNKYGEESFAFVVLELAAENLSELEQKHLDEARKTGRCCNAAPIADPPRGWRHSDETKAAARARATGIVVSESTREKLRQLMRDRLPFSEEKKAEIAAKISAAHKGRVVTESTRELLRKARTGTKQTPEANLKRSLTQTGQKRGPEFSKKASAAKILSYQNNPDYKAKLSEALRVRHRDPKYKAIAAANLPDTRKKVGCSNGEIYASVAEASVATGVHVNTIRQRCYGRVRGGVIKLQFWFATEIPPREPVQLTLFA